jgi:hypothetical protein
MTAPVLLGGLFMFFVLAIGLLFILMVVLGLAWWLVLAWMVLMF